MTKSKWMLSYIYAGSLLLVIGFLPTEAYIISGFEGIARERRFNISNQRCNNGRFYDDICHCQPCWEGDSCDKYEDNYAPRFLVHKATAVVPVNVSGAVYRAWSTDEDLGLTCPLGPGESARCPCASVIYQLFSPPGDHHFTLHPNSGILTRTKGMPSLRPQTTYTYKLMVQSTPVAGYTKDLLYDILDLDIYVGTPYVRKIPWT